MPLSRPCLTFSRLGRWELPNTELDGGGVTAGFNSVIYRLQQPFDLSLVLLEMDRPTKPELEARLVIYRDLARQFFDPVSVENMRLATAELEEKIRDCKE